MSTELTFRIPRDLADGTELIAHCHPKNLDETIGKLGDLVGSKVGRLRLIEIRESASSPLGEVILIPAPMSSVQSDGEAVRRKL